MAVGEKDGIRYGFGVEFKDAKKFIIWARWIYTRCGMWNLKSRRSSA